VPLYLIRLFILLGESTQQSTPIDTPIDTNLPPPPIPTEMNRMACASFAGFGATLDCGKVLSECVLPAICVQSLATDPNSCLYLQELAVHHMPTSSCKVSESLSFGSVLNDTSAELTAARPTRASLVTAAPSARRPHHGPVLALYLAEADSGVQKAACLLLQRLVCHAVTTRPPCRVRLTRATSGCSHRL